MAGAILDRVGSSRFGISGAAKALAVATMALVSFTAQNLAAAEQAELAGSWSGGGSVTYSSGSREKARCRATFSKLGATAYKVNATCATASGKVAQQANVRRAGANTFTGSFRNAEYNMEGTIHISVNGNSQNVTLTSSQASASLRLNR
jgi:hypothetical protein